MSFLEATMLTFLNSQLQLTFVTAALVTGHELLTHATGYGYRCRKSYFSISHFFGLMHYSSTLHVTFHFVASVYSMLLTTWN